jgi:peptidoglycan/xylan/chitin deacetylase (PgdA/CDA1 family)
MRGASEGGRYTPRRPRGGVPSLARTPLVLMYHGFGTRPAEADPYNLFVPVEDFERQLRMLTRYFRPLDLDGFMSGIERGRWPSRSFLVTIDDGFVSVLEDAAPLLARHSVPAVAFVCPGRFGGSSGWMEETADEDLLDADGVRALREHGIEVGVHSMDHTLLPDLPAEELRRQVVESRAALADVLGVEPRSFAYPEGRFDGAAVRAVREAGYAVAFSVDEGGFGRFTVPRVPVNTKDSSLTFAVKLVPGFKAIERMSVGHPGVRRVAAKLAGQRGR